MPPKHPRAEDTADDAGVSPPAPSKRPRTSPPTLPQRPAHVDLLSSLSDELLLRILACLSPFQLLHSLALVSRRFHRLAQDSQLWKALYYARFVLPRALRIPGFRREGGSTRTRERKLHYKGRRALWADGRLGGLVREQEEEAATMEGVLLAKSRAQEGADAGANAAGVNWMRQFKIRHNWARGKCAVEELKLGPDPGSREHTRSGDDEEDRSKMLVKVVEGLAITADATFGLRAWDLKTKEVMSQIELRDARDEHDSAPSCMAIDAHGLEKGGLDISVGFVNGSFGVWRLGEDKCLARRYRHEKSSNGELLGMAYSHPYLLTATGAVLVSLYTFDVPEKPDTEREDESDSGREHLPTPTRTVKSIQPSKASLPAPYLMTSLKSHTSDPPLALSIRKTGNITVASIAYTFFTRQGWSIGIQDLHITANRNPKRAPNITTRLAYTAPVQTSSPGTQTPPSQHPSRPRLAQSPPLSASPTTPRTAGPPSHHTALRAQQAAGPTTLSYTHPYLLLTLPDNTLILHLCTVTAAALAISPGIRLWGHTSGISDAEITARGKAVSVSSRGEEMRVWELEGGRPSGVRGSRSVEIRPGAKTREEEKEDGAMASSGVDWEARRNWVGFDDEMVIVLKEARGGSESLLVYDFT